MDGWLGTDSSLISCLLPAVEPLILRSRLAEPYAPQGVFTQHHTVLKHPSGEGNEAQSGVSMMATSTASPIQETEVGQRL